MTTFKAGEVVVEWRANLTKLKTDNANAEKMSAKAGASAAKKSLEQLEVSEKYAVLDDVVQTSCNFFEQADYCDEMVGLDLLGDTEIAPEYFYVHVVEDENSMWVVTDHVAVKLSLNQPLFDSMMDSDEIGLSEPL